MELDVKQQVPKAIQCPECDHDIPVNPDWQEEDNFACPNCSMLLQVTGVEPLSIDVSPETGATWDDSDNVQPLALDEVEEMADQADDDLEEDQWDQPVSRRAATLRSSRPRKQVRKESIGKMESDAILLTPEGTVRLQQELANLKTVRLPRATAWLSDAVAEGFGEEDVTELEEARSALALIKGRLRKLEDILWAAAILPEPESNDRAQLGSRVTVVEGDYEPETYRIVSPAEANPSSGFISDVSPLGRKLVGQQVDDVVTVDSPDGPIEFRIAKIQ